MSDPALDPRESRRRACLEAMGIPCYLLRSPRQQLPSPSVTSQETPVSAPQTQPKPKEPSVAEMDWDQLEAAVRGCRGCDLHVSRKQAVLGVGKRDAELMIVGEAPGAEEDRLGEPFVGRAGKLLDNMLAAIGLHRGEVYIANILKCRPPGNRNPSVEEAAACAPYLQRQLALVAPRVILALGGVAAHNLLATEESVGRLRGRLHPLPGGEGEVLVTYHPAYLLRRPEEKAKAWADLQQLWRLLHE